VHGAHLSETTLEHREPRPVAVHDLFTGTSALRSGRYAGSGARS
jgi:hypothetical protein